MLLNCEKCGMVIKFEDDFYFKKRMANRNIRKICPICGHMEFEVAI